MSRLTSIIPLVVAGFMAAPSMAATFTTFADEASFLAAATATTTEDFNGFLADTSFDGASFDLGPFSLSADATNQGRNIIDVPPNASNSSDIDGTPFVSLFLNNSSFTIDFDDPIFAIGFDLQNFGNVGDNRSFSLLGDIVDTGSTGSSTVYFGLISDTAFSSVTFANTVNDGFSLDNLSYGAIAAVPLPAGLPMLLASLGVFGLMRRR